ncbi:hypothetical protein [Syntrophomonas palmitatica]|uniref:hypothetical protein n=1 Tax=Syntrophomonas palmitatica TaxID=402877 RepID=UPI001A9A2D1B|nr:hypothetical protein [Syntrophomonas palmitatica]
MLVSLPQSYLIIILGFALCGLSISVSKALLVAVVDALFSHFIHQYPLWFGFHTLFFVTVSVAACYILTRHGLLKIMAAILAGTIVAAALQSVYVPLSFTASHTTVMDLPSRPWLVVLIYIPEPIIMVILYHLVKKYGFQIMNNKAETY